jgi:hypothetical protein
MHTSRCQPRFTPAIVVPLPNEQQPCLANVPTSIGAVSRRHALVCCFTSFAGAPYIVVEFRYPGRPSVFASLGGLPFGRILVSLDCDDCVVTAFSDAVVWREEMRDFDPEEFAR